jgi:hypothetical protein
MLSPKRILAMRINIPRGVILIFARQNEATIAISAIDPATFIHLQPDTWMAQSGGDIAGPVTGDAAAINTDCFGRNGHAYGS